MSLVFLAGLLMSALFSMVEAAVISQDRHRLAHLAEQGGRRAQLMQKMTARMDRLLSAILLFNNIANVLCATAAAVMVTRLSGGGEGAAFAASLGVAFLILVVAEISPKIIGVRHAQRLSLWFALPLRGLLTVFYPAVAVANFLASCLLAAFGIRETAQPLAAMSAAELRTAARESTRRARESNDEEGGRHYRMVEQVLQLADTPVEKIMTPRGQIEGVNLQDEHAIYRQIMDATHAKMPVFAGDIDAAEGFIDTLEVIKAASKRGGADAALVRAMQKRPPMFVPAAADSLSQMQSMRRQRARIALVVDGAGRVSGVITLSNFAAAIIGGEEAAAAGEAERWRLLAGRFFADSPGRLASATDDSGNFGGEHQRINFGDAGRDSVQPGLRPHRRCKNGNHPVHQNRRSPSPHRLPRRGRLTLHSARKKNCERRRISFRQFFFGGVAKPKE